MPTRPHRQSKQPSVRVEYNLVEDALEESQQTQWSDVRECRLPKYHEGFKGDAKFRYGVSFATWLGLLSFLAFIGIAIAFTTKFLVEGSKTGFDPASLDFALYKNTRFEECQTMTPPDAATCRDVRANLLSLAPGNYHEFTDQGISVVIQPYIVSKNRTSTPGGDPVTYAWCQAVSCLGDTFKIVPSTPRSSAFVVNPLTIWCGVAITLFTTVWSFRQRNGARLLQRHKERKPEQACRALKDVAWYDWIFHTYDLCSLVWWWVSFARFVTNPAYTAAPNSIGWVVPWKYAVLMQYHPYSCASATRRRPRTISWGLDAIALLQWIATVYVLHINSPTITESRTPFQAYDCATSYMAEAPGVSPCSTQQLCSNSWFLTHPGFIYRDELLNSGIYELCFFVVFTLAAFISISRFAFPLFELLGGDRPMSIEQVKNVWGEYKVSPTVTLAAAAWCGGMLFGGMFTATVIRSNNRGQEAPLTIYPACNAVHVALSPWRFYLDVDDYQKTLRVVKMWFNA